MGDLESTHHCGKKAVLLKAYGAAIDAFSSAVQALRTDSSLREFQDHLSRSETAKLECEVMRRALNEHRMRHGC
jgi:hypothetical protein